MIITAHADDFARLCRGEAPDNLRPVADSTIAPPEVMAMLGELAAAIARDFAPSAWLIVEDGEVVGLCSITRPPQDGEIHIGYGVAPTREGRGHASRAVAELLAWARHDPRVTLVSAETATDNVASQRVLERNGFARTGTRIDPEDGEVICWQASAAS